MNITNRFKLVQKDPVYVYIYVKEITNETKVFKSGLSRFCKKMVSCVISKKFKSSVMYLMYLIFFIFSVFTFFRNTKIKSSAKGYSYCLRIKSSLSAGTRNLQIWYRFHQPLCHLTKFMKLEMFLSLLKKFVFIAFCL